MEFKVTKQTNASLAFTNLVLVSFMLCFVFLSRFQDAAEKLLNERLSVIDSSCSLIPARYVNPGKFSELEGMTGSGGADDAQVTSSEHTAKDYDT